MFLTESVNQVHSSTKILHNDLCIDEEKRVGVRRTDDG